MFRSALFTLPKLPPLLHPLPNIQYKHIHTPPDLSQTSQAQFTGNTLITGQELANLITNNQTGTQSPNQILIIDVRSPQEITQLGLIPTAVPLPLNELKHALSIPHQQFQLMYQFPKPSREVSNIVMYCKAGVRAEMAVVVARELGYKKVRCYYGSFNEWQQLFSHIRPKPVTTNTPPTTNQ